MNLSIGDKVKLEVPMSYLKTVDIRPVLRPPDLVGVDEIGEIVGIRGENILEVRFRRGEFLIPFDRLVIINSAI